MEKHMELKFGNDIKIVTPNSYELITPYVIREQNDWFEDEIKFIRKYIQPNSNAIDIGANYGVFTLSIAKINSRYGEIWAFEPTSTTANYLNKSILANNFKNIILDSCGVSNYAGEAKISLNTNSELNEIIRTDTISDAEKPFEHIQLTSLDLAMEKYKWSKIDFLKIDAEGEESKIIDGGKAFFKKLSPLVQFEIKAGSKLNFDLVEKFSKIGYETYQLIPGINILAPFEIHNNADNYLLNLFCCKADQAFEMEKSGLLVTRGALLNYSKITGEELLFKWNGTCAFDIRQKSNEWPYVKKLKESWNFESLSYKELEDAVSLFLISQSESINPIERYLSLCSSHELLMQLTNQSEYKYDLTRLTAARVARSLGRRTICVAHLNSLIENIQESGNINLTKPFLVESEYYEHAVLNHDIINWAFCSILELLEKSQNYSSFFGDKNTDRLKLINDLGYGSTEMTRRLQLINELKNGV